MKNTIRTVKIKNITKECYNIKTFTFNMKNGELEDYISPKPGQFALIWVPGIDEVPMSISGYDNDGNWSITVKNVGECTNAIFQLKIGDYIGVRGPLGNYFELPNNDSKIIFLIGGGIGIASLKCLASELHKKKFKLIIIESVKIKNEIIFINDFQAFNNENSEIFYTTDDGSYGLKGFASDFFEKLIRGYSQENLSDSMAYTCGPEKMMYKIFRICETYNIQLQASLERIMRCGCGLCGLCAIDPLGLLVCKDGPIFNSEYLRKMEDFGKFKRDITGKKIPLD